MMVEILCYAVITRFRVGTLVMANHNHDNDFISFFKRPGHGEEYLP